MIQIKLFSIPIIGSEALVSEMNAFLRSKKVLHTEKQLVQVDNSAYWCFCVTYMDDATKMFPVGKEKIDYFKVLDAQTFKKFSAMREVRKKIASDHAVPAYNVFIDAELAAIAKMEHPTLASLKSIKGIGTKRIEKFGQLFLDSLSKEETDTN